MSNWSSPKLNWFFLGRRYTPPTSSFCVILLTSSQRETNQRHHLMISDANSNSINMNICPSQAVKSLIHNSDVSSSAESPLCLRSLSRASVAVLQPKSFPITICYSGCFWRLIQEVPSPLALLPDQQLQTPGGIPSIRPTSSFLSLTVLLSQHILFFTLSWFLLSRKRLI